jgi:hypothetical protein
MLSNLYAIKGDKSMTNKPSDDNDNVLSLWRLNFQVAGFNDHEEWISFHILLVQFNIRSLYKIKMFNSF